MIININALNGNYDIVVEKNAIDKIEEYINLKRKVLVITDSGVPLSYASKVIDKCLEGYLYIIEQGEKSKNIDNFTKILSFMVDKAFTRTDCVVAVGGGVVGDLSGFVSSCYMRGIDFYNIPTTLLSQVDSSIGGKTAVDFNGVKNIVGSFYQPKMVIIDSNTLKTLDTRQLHAGLVEAIKMATTSNRKLFELIEQSQDLESDLDEIIIQALLIKKTIVELDPLEQNIRKVLNFGHTIGHAIESLSNEGLLHGEAVGIGMLYFSFGEVRNRIKKILEKYNLPTSTMINKEDIIKLIKHDKKASGDMVTCLLVKELGSYIMEKRNINQLL